LISRRTGKTVVSIPLDVALQKVEYLKGIEPTPLVHKPEQLDESKFKEEIKRVQNDVGACRTELKAAKNNLSDVKKLLKKTKQIRDNLHGEAEAVEKRRDKVKADLDRLVGNWKTAYHHLCEVFGLEHEELDLSSADSIELSGSIISEKYVTAQGILESDLAEQLKNYPQFAEKYRGQKPIDVVKAVTKEFQDRIDQMTKLQDEYKKVNEWILTNGSQVKSLENRNRTAEIMKVGLVVALELFSRVYAKADVKKIIEELAEKIEVNVKDVYSKIFPEDETFSFDHLEKGQFLSTIKNEPITHPSGSQRVAISIGIMLSLGETFGLPILLDEAFDRIDVNRLRFFTEYITGISTSYNVPQMCLAGFTTFNIEKNPEVLHFVNNWKIYCVKKKGVLEKTIELLKEFPSG
jgi:DNA repair exonuclease SbcCD ATPase subunit